jgi:hypothetical protein
MFIVFGGTVIESIDMEAAKFAMTWDRLDSDLSRWGNWEHRGQTMGCGQSSRIPIYQISKLARCETWNCYFLAKS